MTTATEQLAQALRTGLEMTQELLAIKRDALGDDYSRTRTYWEAEREISAALAQQAQAVPASKWEDAEEWMPLAWELCANECGEEACTELVWEGGPIPEPWGDRWLKYEDQAKEMIAMVRKHVAVPPPSSARAASYTTPYTHFMRLSPLPPPPVAKEPSLDQLRHKLGDWHTPELSGEMEGKREHA
jgi:hypothetical protein